MADVNLYCRRRDFIKKLKLAEVKLSVSSPSAVPEFSFDSGSAVRFQLRGGGSSSRRTNIQLLLRTRAASGTLLSVTSREAGESIVLEVGQSQTQL